ncbi:MucR family transcriptional regulator [Alsobacter soli]|nr:MucR family transcriptional regulator [Alsobacter soli]
MLQRVADVVAAYVANNAVPTQDVAWIVARVHEAFMGAACEATEEPQQAPAVPLSKSVRADAIICLEDGRPYTSLRRHLTTRYGMSPADCRAKWGLPNDYPMVAPNYAAKRSALARDMGLGAIRRHQRSGAPAQDGGVTAQQDPEPQDTPVTGGSGPSLGGATADGAAANSNDPEGPAPVKSEQAPSFRGE